MGEYLICCDSSGDIPNELIEQYGIHMIPYYVSFDREHYMKEREDITIDGFYEKIMTEKIFPKTSLPSIEDYKSVFEKALEQNLDVMCICLSHKFSGSYQAAVNARNILLEEYPGANIIVIDSAWATAAEGLFILQAAKMKQVGYTLEENVTRLEQLKQKGRIVFTVDTLDYLQEGGRIGKAASLAGKMLNLKPLIQMKEGELIPYSNVRGRKKALEKIVEMAKEYFEETQENPKDYEFVMTQCAALEEALQIQPKVEEIFGIQMQYQPFLIGTTIGTYTGPRVVGISFMKRYDAL